MAFSDDDLTIARGRVSQVFRFLEAFNQLRNPVKRLINEQPWVLWLHDIPNHPAIQQFLFRDTKSDADPDVSRENHDAVLKVCRPRRTSAPTPPSEVAEWLVPGWDDVYATVQVQLSRNEEDENGTRIVRFEDSPARLEALNEWRLVRDEWAVNETPASQAAELFERLYALYGQLDREAERVELVLGDGILNWRLPEGGVEHPVLLLRLQMEFDPAIPEFTIREADRPVELYSALFRILPDVDGRAIGRCVEELESAAFHPLGGEDTSGFLQRLAAQLSARGESVGQGRPDGHASDPRLGRAPVMFLRARNLGFATAIERILQHLQEAEDLPSSLARLVGIETAPAIQDQNGNGQPVIANEDQDILLSKPANAEQLRIAQRLAQFGAALVQGPPGTGKTHTIGNLIGHLLSQGKSILVTSHTTKALRMVRDHVVEDLQPLCVSVLERDAASRDQLGQSIRTIVARASEDAEVLEAQARDLASERRNVLRRLEETRHRLLLAREAEYRDIVVDGTGYHPSQAARLVAERAGVDAWIPGPVAGGDPLPLTPQEVVALYQSNHDLTPDIEREIASRLPPIADLHTPAAFDHLVEEVARVTENIVDLRSDLWQVFPNASDLDKLETLCRRAGDVADSLGTEESWRITAINAGHLGSPHRQPWDSLLTDIQRVAKESAQSQELLLRHVPRISKEFPPEQQARLFEEIATHLESGGSLGWWTYIKRRSWKRLIGQVSVEGSNPRPTDHFKALAACAHVTEARAALSGLWDRLGVPLGLPAAAELGEQPELNMAQFHQPITEALSWHEQRFVPLVTMLTHWGFDWEALLTEIPPNVAPNGEILRIRAAIVDHLLPILTSRAAYCRRIQLEGERAELAQRIRSGSVSPTTSEVTAALSDAVQGNDCSSYRRAYDRLADLHERKKIFEAREQWIQCLDRTAPTWASAIRNRHVPHNAATPPGDAVSAWLWRQLSDELDRRCGTSLQELQMEIANLTAQLQQTTSALVDKRAWAAQIRRTTLEQRQALTGWVQTMDRIGRGTGRYAPRRQAEARRLLMQCQMAVPVWILPLARVVENFEPGACHFDVVIIDEASQADLMGLAVLYMGKQVIVVGDDEQVSPDAIGLDLSQVHHLQEQFLLGIPNAHLYEGQTSVYDLAQQCFGGVTRLVEHFRCVPEIIQFSNHLCYNLEIKPLRDASQVCLKPHVLAHRVEGGVSQSRTNQAEACTAASLVAAAMEQPEYQVNSQGAPTTFGVVSLVGDEQAAEIEKLLRLHISPIEYQRRRITCGNAAQFQGDERDVMFLSVVDAPSGDGPLALRAEGANRMFKRRYNVATSRARDQMWVVHSLDPRLDLKDGDIRRRLIEHAEDPNALLRLIERGEQRTESEFERLVLRRLVNAGYRVTPQWQVGYYRIDLVVEGNGKRLAIECDGDRYHPPEKLAEDLSRQAILERLGWTFLRIRGSEFFRDPDRAMQSAFDRLESLGIPPEGSDDSGQENDHEAQELRARVTRRAAEIRREWEGDHYDIAEGIEPLKVQISTPTSNAQAVGDSESFTNQPPESSDREYPHGGHSNDAPEYLGPVGECYQESRESTVGTAANSTLPKAETAFVTTSITDLLRDRGLEVIDKRPSGGALWVVGGLQLRAPYRSWKVAEFDSVSPQEGAKPPGGVLAGGLATE